MIGVTFRAYMSEHAHHDRREPPSKGQTQSNGKTYSPALKMYMWYLLLIQARQETTSPLVHSLPQLPFMLPILRARQQASKQAKAKLERSPAPSPCTFRKATSTLARANIAGFTDSMATRSQSPDRNSAVAEAQIATSYIEEASLQITPSRPSIYCCATLLRRLPPPPPPRTVMNSCGLLGSLGSMKVMSTLLSSLKSTGFVM